MTGRTALPLIVVLALALGVSACGRKGPLEPPPAPDTKKEAPKTGALPLPVTRA